MIFWKVMAAHLINDFIVQSRKIAENKTIFKYNFLHCLFFFILVLLFLIDRLTINVVLTALIISIFHGLLDYTKARVDRMTGGKANWIFFLLDQLMHFGIILLAIYLFGAKVPSFNRTHPGDLLQISNLFKTVSFIVIITAGGIYFTSSACGNIRMKIKADVSSCRLIRTGPILGIIERIIVSASIIIGRYEIILILVVLKTAVRFLQAGRKNHLFWKYYTIGTVSSISWALVFSLLFLTFD